MLPDVAFLSLVLTGLVMAARFSRLFQAMMAQLLSRDMVAPLRAALKGAHPPQALPSSESRTRAR
jgi:hypothetical protein